MVIDGIDGPDSKKNQEIKRNEIKRNNKIK